MSDTECRDCRKVAMLEQELEEKAQEINRLEQGNKALLEEIRRLRAVVRSLEEINAEQTEALSGTREKLYLLDGREYLHLVKQERVSYTLYDGSLREVASAELDTADSTAELSQSFIVLRQAAFDSLDLAPEKIVEIDPSLLDEQKEE